MCQNCVECHFLNGGKSQRKDLKISSPVGPIDRKSRKKKIKLLRNYLLTDSENILQYVLGMCQNCLKCHFLNPEEVTEKDGNLKICPPAGQSDDRKATNMDKLLSN